MSKTTRLIRSKAENRKRSVASTRRNGERGSQAKRDTRAVDVEVGEGIDAKNEPQPEGDEGQSALEDGGQSQELGSIGGIGHGRSYRGCAQTVHKTGKTAALRERRESLEFWARGVRYKTWKVRTSRVKESPSSFSPRNGDGDFACAGRVWDRAGGCPSYPAPLPRGREEREGGKSAHGRSLRAAADPLLGLLEDVDGRRRRLGHGLGGRRDGRGRRWRRKGRGWG